MKAAVRSPSQVPTVASTIFPLLQATNILALKARFVYSNVDNKAFVELVREVAARCNRFVGDFFPLPELVHGRVPLVPGTDGNKMSTSKGNCIFLTDSKDTIRKKVKQMFTDPNRVRSNVPGDTTTNPVFIYHRLFNDNSAMVHSLEQLYKSGEVGDVTVKELLAEALNGFLSDIREAALENRNRTSAIATVLERGQAAASAVIADTLSGFAAATSVGKVQLHNLFEPH
jgi:tryptophanyl-tRNA synthetase